MEQVLKTASALRAEGFSDVSTKEVLIRTYDLVAAPPAGSHHLMDVTSIADRLKVHEKRKEERRITQMRNAREKSRLAKEEAAKAGTSEAAEAAEGHGEKRKQEEATDEPAKKPRVTEPEKAEETAEAIDIDDSEEPAIAVGTQDEPEIAWSSMVLTKPSPEMRGHTSYLTFATFYPADIRAKIAAQDDATVPPTRDDTPVADAVKVDSTDAVPA